MMKTIFKSLFLLACAGLAAQNLNAQGIHKCGNVEADKAVYEKYPEMREQIKSLENYLNTMDFNSFEKKTRADDSTTIYIVPLVFHVVHNYGPENISDDQIRRAVKSINADYSKTNWDTINTLAIFKPIAAKVNIEFRLATKDPEGNCTNGIDRIESYKTYFGGDQAKINQWPRNNYFNIWVINNFDVDHKEAAAYAYKPATAQNLFFYDGVITLSTYVGDAGAAQHTLSHEIGHCLNLDHTWGSTNNPQVSCGDDGVLDTPVTMGHDACTTADLNDDHCTPGTIENTQNFMEYSYCDNMFTWGQKARMRSAITTTVAQRNSLISPLAHLNSGIDDARFFTKPDCAPKADFVGKITFSTTTVNANPTINLKNFGCLGNSFAFYNRSYGDTLSSAAWTFADGSPLTSTSTSLTTPVNVAFNTAGWKDISLTANSNAGSGSKTRSSYIYVSDPSDKNLVGVENTFEDTSDYKRWPIFNYWNNEFKFDYYNGYNTHSGWKCLFYKGFDGRLYPNNILNDPNGDVDDIISPSYDVTSLSSGNAFFGFYIAGATRAAIASDMADTMHAYYTIDCGTTWKEMFTAGQNVGLSGIQLANNGSVPTEFKPMSTTIWSPVSYVIPAAALTSNTYFKIRMTPGKSANNIYVDDIALLSKPTAVDAYVKNNFSLEVVPNPATNQATIEINSATSGKASIVITDLLGRTVFTSNEQITSTRLNKIQLPSSLLSNKGMYLVTVRMNDKSSTQKLVIQ